MGVSRMKGMGCMPLARSASEGLPRWRCGLVAVAVTSPAWAATSLDSLVCSREGQCSLAQVV